MRQLRCHVGAVGGDVEIARLQQLRAWRGGGRMPGQLDVTLGRVVALVDRDHVRRVVGGPGRTANVGPHRARTLLSRQRRHESAEGEVPDGRHTAQWERVAANAPFDRQHGRIRQHEVGDGVGLDGEDPRGETVPLVLLEQRRIAHLMEELFVDLIGSQPLDDLAFHQLPVDLLGEAADGGIRRQRAGETAFDAPRLRIAEAQIELGEREHAVDCGPRRQFLEDQFLPVGVRQRDGRGRRCGVIGHDSRGLV